ncbi:receptor protein-tyrosine kinase CEPR1 [Capsicum chacoense]|uniref:receptor protein-tyrosine kinase CEPR1 n=1 Tax=Capsicum annuum TaxID=4072 RepID=UPI001FB07BE0|nr:receptor protein-tyrosine kinase CEPR1 [Capsicum annuum]
MTIHKIITFVFVLTLSNFVQGTTKNDQSEFFVVMKKYVTGNCLSNWDIGNQFVNYEGIDCDEQGNVVKIDITGSSPHQRHAYRHLSKSSACTMSPSICYGRKEWTQHFILFYCSLFNLKME